MGLQKPQQISAINLSRTFVDWRAEPQTRVVALSPREKISRQCWTKSNLAGSMDNHPLPKRFVGKGPCFARYSEIPGNLTHYLYVVARTKFAS